MFTSPMGRLKARKSFSLWKIIAVYIPYG